MYNAMQLLKCLIDRKDNIVDLSKGWQNSKGCMAEFEVARIYGKEIMFEK